MDFSKKSYIKDFQSYQGSIFTVIPRDALILSILLSILSRFNFYAYVEYTLIGPIFFQSYQGSIFTVLTLLNRQKRGRLSILSRFNFYKIAGKDK